MTVNCFVKKIHLAGKSSEKSTIFYLQYY